MQNRANVVPADAGSPPEDIDARSVADAVVKFKEVSEFTTFFVKYTIRDTDFIIQFFVSPELGAKPIQEQTRFWKFLFPVVLSPVAEEYFQATLPRISAEFIPELNSWYMRCRGFATGLDPDTYITRFFEALDVALDKA